MRDKDSPRILVIDDSVTLRKLVEIAFRGTGAQVDFAPTGTDGLQRATANPPDVILLDFMLPDMGGTDVCARLAEPGRAAAPPVVIMSAKREGLREAFRAFPFVVDFVPKPFAMEEIRSRLRAAMRGHTQADAATTAAAAAEVSLAGDLAVVPLLDALRFVSTIKLTGRMTLDLSDRVEIYVKDGDVVMCTTHAPPAPGDLDHVDLSRTPRAAIDRASADQAQTGKPAVVSLTEEGLVPREVAPIALRDQASRLLSAALAAKSGKLAWRSQAPLPDYVEEFGRPQAVIGIALEQRRSVFSGMEVTAVFQNAVYQRTERFSRKLAGARLSASERKLLSLFDGETPMSAILERTGVPAEKAASVCNRLVAVGLIELREHSGSSGQFSGIALWSPGDAEFGRSLRTLLQRRAPPLEVIDLVSEDDFAAAIMRARPRLILVTDPTSARTDLMAGAARTLSSALVAVLDTASRAAADACLSAGFHAVLAKPIHLNDLERLLSS
ncbi:MAG TPA: response regulator [Kofleriaceae bacterium]|nr:response regulator [Kofleriaceae bacterium]